MKVKSLLVFLLFCFFGFIPTSVYAHLLKTDGSIGAVLHIDPGDDPIAGLPSGFFLEFKDKLGRFKPGNCDCKAIILKAGKQIYSQSLIDQSSDNGGDSATFTFTFPSKGEYQLKIDGKNSGGVSFEPFELGYDIDVDKEAKKSSFDQLKSLVSYSNFGHFVVAAIVLLFFIFAFTKQRLEKGKNKNE